MLTIAFGTLLFLPSVVCPRMHELGFWPDYVTVFIEMVLKEDLLGIDDFLLKVCVFRLVLEELILFALPLSLLDPKTCLLLKLLVILRCHLTFLVGSIQRLFNVPDEVIQDSGVRSQILPLIFTSEDGF
jgi:hypothetical protein